MRLSPTGNTEGSSTLRSRWSLRHEDELALIPSAVHRSGVAYSRWDFREAAGRLSLNLSPILSALEDLMPRLDPKSAAQYQHIHPLRSKMFVRPLTGAATLDAVTDFVAECFAHGVPTNAVIGPEGSNMVARWAVPMEDYPRNR